MGMFNYIKAEIPCKNCSYIITEFQSKDGLILELLILDYWQVDNFYTDCPSCGVWNEYFRKEKKPYVPLSHYELTEKEMMR